MLFLTINHNEGTPWVVREILSKLRKEVILSIWLQKAPCNGKKLEKVFFFFLIINRECFYTVSGSNNKTYTNRWRGRKHPTRVEASCKLSTHLYIKMSITVPSFYKNHKLPNTKYSIMQYISWVLSPMPTHNCTRCWVSLHVAQGHWVSACIRVKPLYEWVLQRQDNLLTVIQTSVIKMFHFYALVTAL